MLTPVLAFCICIVGSYICFEAVCISVVTSCICLMTCCTCCVVAFCICVVAFCISVIHKCTCVSFYLQSFLDRKLVPNISATIQSGLAPSWCSSSSQNCLMGLERANSSRPSWENNFFMNLTSCTGALSCCKRKRPPLNCCHKAESTLLSYILLCTGTLRFPVI